MVWAMVKPSEKINYTIFLIVMPLGLSVKLRCDQRLVIEQKKSNALALKIVSLKCNALVIMY